MKETKMDRITTEMAEHICDNLCKHLCQNLDQEELEEICADCELGHFICDILNEHNKQPTAYDVDKVVEQLEDEKRIAFLTLANTGDKVKDAVYDEVMAYLNTAIEIVKAGGVE